MNGVDQEGQGAAGAPVRVFLLDDHEVVRRGLRDLLEGSGGIEIVGEAARADEALRRIPAVRPDVAVLDAQIPDDSGIEVWPGDPVVAALGRVLDPDLLRRRSALRRHHGWGRRICAQANPRH